MPYWLAVILAVLNIGAVIVTATVSMVAARNEETLRLWCNAIECAAWIVVFSEVTSGWFR